MVGQITQTSANLRGDHLVQLRHHLAISLNAVLHQFVALHPRQPACVSQLPAACVTNTRALISSLLLEAVRNWLKLNRTDKNHRRLNGSRCNLSPSEDDEVGQTGTYQETIFYSQVLLKSGASVGVIVRHVDLQGLVGALDGLAGQLGMRLVQQQLLPTPSSRGQVEHFIDRFRANYVSVDLRRVGGWGDGGYLVPQILGRVSHCFSPGVGNIASFESELSAAFAIKSFLADGSVQSAPAMQGDFHFTQKFLGSRSAGDFITLSDWMDASLNGTESDLLLQMDIEGGEYDVLAFESRQTLRRFSCMVMEFHHLQNLFQMPFLQMATGIFEKIYQDFAVCHVHPNNAAGIVSSGDIQVPVVMEVTFVRNDLLESLLNGGKISLPHALDCRNVTYQDDIVMPAGWWS